MPKYLWKSVDSIPFQQINKAPTAEKIIDFNKTLDNLLEAVQICGNLSLVIQNFKQSRF